MVRERLHGAEKGYLFSSNFKPYEVNFSEMELKDGTLLAHVDKPLLSKVSRHAKFMYICICFFNLAYKIIYKFAYLGLVEDTVERVSRESRLFFHFGEWEVEWEPLEELPLSSGETDDGGVKILLLLLFTMLLLLALLLLFKRWCKLGVLLAELRDLFTNWKRQNW